MWFNLCSTILLISVSSCKWIESWNLIPSSANFILLIFIPDRTITIFTANISSCEWDSKHIEIHHWSNWMFEWLEVSSLITNPMLSILPTAWKGAATHDEGSFVFQLFSKPRIEGIMGSFGLHMTHEWMSINLLKSSWRMCGIKSNSILIQIVSLWNEGKVEGWLVYHIFSSPSRVPRNILWRGGTHTISFIRLSL